MIIIILCACLMKHSVGLNVRHSVRVQAIISHEYCRLLYLLKTLAVIRQIVLCSSQDPYLQNIYMEHPFTHTYY